VQEGGDGGAEERRTSSSWEEKLKAVEDDIT
jgi:hypothetical protein